MKTEIWCCACSERVMADLVGGKDVYPHREDLYDLRFYKCPHCGNFVGTHKADRRPLGCIPTPELKYARQKIHEILDPLWQGKAPGTRKKIYQALSDALGYEYHTANTRTIEECRTVYKHVLEFKRSEK